MVHTTVLGHQTHPRPGEVFKRFDLRRIDGVVHDTGDHGVTIRPGDRDGAASTRARRPNGSVTLVLRLTKKGCEGTREDGL
ncbi:hypothetical protein ACQRWP_02440 [Micromonospora trifolii]|uniref:hypothetical protein n=1 Tax=Micromonospora trifolii TaxID=2911208 RepID=UPI003D2EC105